MSELLIDHFLFPEPGITLARVQLATGDWVYAEIDPHDPVLARWTP